MKRRVSSYILRMPAPCLTESKIPWDLPAGKKPSVWPGEDFILRGYTMCTAQARNLEAWHSSEEFLACLGLGGMPWRGHSAGVETDLWWTCCPLLPSEGGKGKGTKCDEVNSSWYIFVTVPKMKLPKKKQSCMPKQGHILMFLKSPLKQRVQRKEKTTHPYVHMSTIFHQEGLPCERIAALDLHATVNSSD